MQGKTTIIWWCSPGKDKIHANIFFVGIEEEAKRMDKNVYTENELPLPHELFYYAAKHQVLICIPCRYAIQPTSIPRHLKEIHHIRRGKRVPFISYAKKLKLRSPENVIPPAPEEFPVSHLPVERGWRCTHPECNYMCVSTKRMQSHWSARHGRRCDPDHDMQSVSLQTFFRGNQLRYFTHSQRACAYTSRLGSPFLSCLQSKHNLDPIDQILLKHYFDSAYKSFAHCNQTENIWLHVVPPLAHEHAFLMHGILGCSALHMAYLEPGQRRMYTIRACAHQDLAIPLFRGAMDNPTEENCDAIMAFAYLLVVYSIAADGETAHNSLLLVNDCNTGLRMETLIIPQWLHFIRIGCSMLRDVWKRIESGPVSVLATAWEAATDIGDLELPHLDHFLAIMPNDSSWSEESVAIYRSAALSLAKSFAFIDKADTESIVSTWSILGMWPVSVDAGYLDLLYERHPGALILLAYYCIILKQMQQRWYFAGGASKLMASILSFLDVRWWPCIERAIRIVEE